MQRRPKQQDQPKKLKREAREQCRPGRYERVPNVKFPRLLDSIEEKIISSRMPVVQTEFSLEVTLKRINANGVFVEEKRTRFTAEEIMGLIHRLNNKQGNFYLDRAIFDALCRVERGKVTNRIRSEVYRRGGGCCAKCGSTFNLEVDHIIPISKGGKSVMDNLQLLCHRCNVEKGSKIE